MESDYSLISDKIEETAKKSNYGNIILIGDRPIGRLHLGHLVSSLSQRVKLQNSGMFDEIYIEIADA